MALTGTMGRDAFFTYAEIAALLKVPLATVRYWGYLHRINGVRFGSWYVSRGPRWFVFWKGSSWACRRSWSKWFQVAWSRRPTRQAGVRSVPRRPRCWFRAILTIPGGC